MEQWETDTGVMGEKSEAILLRDGWEPFAAFWIPDANDPDDGQIQVAFRRRLPSELKDSP